MCSVYCLALVYLCKETHFISDPGGVESAFGGGAVSEVPE